MQSRANVVVIGGGIIGTSIAYHPIKREVREVVRLGGHGLNQFSCKDSVRLDDSAIT